MKSNNWDYDQKQAELLSRYYVYKLDEKTQSQSKKIDNLIKEFEDDIKNHWEVDQRKKEVEEFEKMKIELIKRTKENNYILAKMPKVTDEEFWKNSLSCIGCIHTFKNLNDLLCHLIIHLDKLDVFSKNEDDDKKRFTQNISNQTYRVNHERIS